MEQKLIESLNKLEAAEIEKQKYIVGIVHEIKTPLAALHSYLDIILGKYLGPVNEKIEEKLTRARMRSAEAMELINDVLKISRIKLLENVKEELIDLKEIICGIIEKQNVNVINKSIDLQFIDERTALKQIKGEKFLIELAISNLINNAVKYTGEHGRIEIRLSSLNNNSRITISDSGVGIPAEDISKIFVDFYRASNIRHKDYDGTGLGLTIVRQIILKHDGEIFVKSPSGIGSPEHPGTAFIVNLPNYNS
jgi:signal transduction histidine kinase